MKSCKRSTRVSDEVEMRAEARRAAKRAKAKRPSLDASLEKKAEEIADPGPLADDEADDEPAAKDAGLRIEPGDTPEEALAAAELNEAVRKHNRHKDAMQPPSEWKMPPAGPIDEAAVWEAFKSSAPGAMDKLRARHTYTARLRYDEIVDAVARLNVTGTEDPTYSKLPTTKANLDFKYHVEHPALRAGESFSAKVRIIRYVICRATKRQAGFGDTLDAVIQVCERNKVVRAHPGDDTLHNWLAFIEPNRRGVREFATKDALPMLEVIMPDKSQRERELWLAARMKALEWKHGKVTASDGTRTKGYKEVRKRRLRPKKGRG